MHTIAQIRRAKARVLIYNLDRTLSLVQALSPGDDGSIELLDFGAVVAYAERDDLRDLSFLQYIHGKEVSCGAYHNLHPCITHSHCCHQLRECRNDISWRFILLHNVIRA